MRRPGPIAIALAALALALAPLACGGDDSQSKVVVHKTVTESASSTTDTTATGSDATTTVPPPARSAPPRHLASFQLPSHNIGCYMSTQFHGNVRCDIRERSWKPPPKPARCDLDWGQGLAVSGAGKPQIVCAGDTTLDPSSPVLAYGQRNKTGPVQCESSQAGITCANSQTGHGFFLSRQTYRVF